ncbi:MAG: pyrroloquinoline quinone precursor peptide PqqA [Acidobacteriota bacterium]
MPAIGVCRHYLWWSVDLRQNLGYSRFTFTVQLWTAGGTMTWTAPAFEEVCLNCEINSYASAKL